MLHHTAPPQVCAKSIKELHLLASLYSGHKSSRNTTAQISGLRRDPCAKTYQQKDSPLIQSDTTGFYRNNHEVTLPSTATTTDEFRAKRMHRPTRVKVPLD